MYKKAINIFTLMAFMMYSFAVSGCTKMVKMSADEISRASSRKLTRLKCENGDDLLWSSSGAEYIARAKSFEGSTIDGSWQRVKLSKVDSVFFVTADSPIEQAMDARTFHESAIRRHWDFVLGKKITSVHSRSGIIMFEGNSGRFDKLNQAVVGIVNSGDTISVPLSEIYSLDVKVNRDSGTITLLLLVPVLIITTLLAWGLSDPLKFGN